MKLEECLNSYIRRGIYPFHMPGHKRNPAFLPNSQFFTLDLTELEDTDDLHSPDGILLSAQCRAAEVFSALRTYFSLGGSTVGLLSAIHAMTRPGDKILVARNCHRSVYHAISLRRLEPIYVYPPEVEDFGFCSDISADSVKRAFRENPDIRLAVITSPTYEGIISDISSIAETAHKYDAMLLVDSAHGAHLGFDEKFPRSPVNQGADVVVQSLHKTLPCFTQTALIHICSQRAISSCDISSALNIYETSSPSYLLMCGIDNCVSLLEKSSKELFSAYVRRLENFYNSCKLEKLSVFNDVSKVFARDISKIVITTRKADINGRELYYSLKNNYKLQLEMYTADSVLAVTSICDTDDGFKRLLYALSEIDEVLRPTEPNDNGISLPALRAVISPYKAAEAEKISVSPENAVGKTAAGLIYAYPPGIPMVVPGEKISDAVIRKIAELMSAGVKLQGTGLTVNGKINVVKTKKLTQLIDRSHEII